MLSQESFELLDVIDRRGSFAKAAEELDKATSAISYGVQKLEEQLGITIFVRQGRRSVLTPAGQLLLEEGRVILAATRRVAERARELANGWETHIRIAVESTYEQGPVFRALAMFQNNFAGIELDVTETLLNGTWEALEQDKVDLVVGAVGPVPAHRGYRSIALGAADLIPVIATSHPGAKEVAESGDPSDVQLVVNHDTAVQEVSRSAGFELSGRKILYVQSMEQKLLAIEAGLGVGHLPRHRVAAGLASGVLLQVGEQGSTPQEYLAWRLTNRGKGLAELIALVQSTQDAQRIDH